MKHIWKETEHQTVCKRCGAEKKRSSRSGVKRVIGYDEDYGHEIIQEDPSKLIMEVVLNGTVVSPVKCPK